MQKVVINSHVSDLKPVIAGVPQGSILGPLLFCIYINDVVSIDNDVKFIIYADDTTILVTAKDAEDVMIKANEVLSKLSSWSTANSLKINVNKTKAVLFRPKNRNVATTTNLHLNNSILPIVPTFKCLGVVFEQHLSWNAHVEMVVGKLSRLTGILCKLRFFLPESVKLLLYKSLFLSYVHYCHLVWGTTTLTNIITLHRMQKKAVRCILDVPYLTPTSPLFEKLNLVPMPNIYENLLIRSYKNAIKKNNDTLKRISNLTRKHKMANTRSSEIWELPRSRTNYTYQMLRYRLPYHLNTKNVI